MPSGGRDTAPLPSSSPPSTTSTTPGVQRPPGHLANSPGTLQQRCHHSVAASPLSPLSPLWPPPPEGEASLARELVASGRLERLAAASIKPQRPGQQPHRAAPGTPDPPSLQLTNRPRAQPGPLGQLLLGQQRPLSMASQQPPETGRRNHAYQAPLRPAGVRSREPAVGRLPAISAASSPDIIGSFEREALLD